MSKIFSRTIFAFTMLANISTGASAQTDTEALATAAQNPVANMISLPFQNNTNFKAGPEHKTQNVPIIQPVIR